MRSISDLLPRPDIITKFTLSRVVVAVAVAVAVVVVAFLTDTASGLLYIFPH